MSETSVAQRIDLSGQNCPMPVLKTKKHLDAMQSGEVLEVITTDPGSKSDIPALIKRLGSELIELKENGGEFTFLIKKG